MSDTDHVPGGLPDPGMIASQDGMRARDPWEMEERPSRICPDCGRRHSLIVD